ncbi:hypothetical protein VYU27_008259 [Nannochloropsis oceanica]
MDLPPAPHREAASWSVWSLAAGLLIVALASSLLAVMDPSALVLSHHPRDRSGGPGDTSPFLVLHQQPRYSPLSVTMEHPHSDEQRKKKGAKEDGKKEGEDTVPAFKDKEVNNSSSSSSSSSSHQNNQNQSTLGPPPSLPPPAPSSFLPQCSYSILQAAPEAVSWSTKEGEGEGGKEGKAVYSPEHKLCILRTFEEGGKEREGGKGGGMEGVYTCMKGKHVVFVGDSVTRYQYLSLVSFLETGTWEEEEEEKSITFKGEWGSWNEYYNLSTSSLNGNEVCDCYREGSRPPYVENRYYTNEEKDLRVTFIGWFGDLAPRLPLFKDVYCSFLRDTLRPTTLLLNTGLWKELDESELKAITAAAKNLTVSKPVEVFWKTTTSSSLKATWVNDSSPRSAFIANGMKVFDSSLFTQALRPSLPAYRDGTTHFVPSVYRGLNLLLFNEIC